MRRLLQYVFAAGLIAGLAAAFLATPFTGLMVLVCCVPLTFAWPANSVSGLQALMVMLALMCFVGTMMTAAWYPWAGVGVFGFLSATVRMQ